MNYRLLTEQLQGLIENENDRIANMANCCALLWMEMRDINWVGFYLLKRNKLVLGPFQGKPACTRITMGSGVCGSAASMEKTVMVADVHQFPGHIACDTRSNSEIVLPIMLADKLIAVLDIDSALHDRFDYRDQQGLESLLYLLAAKL